MQGLACMNRRGLGWLGAALALLAWSCSGDNFGVSVPPRSQSGESAVSGAGGEAQLSDAGEAQGGGGGASGNAAQLGGDTSVSFAGAGGQAMGLTVVSTTPNDAALGIERDQIVEVSLSADVDPETVTGEALSVTGPSGSVAGELTVQGATIIFTPTAKWSVLTDYTIELSNSIAGVHGQPLEGVRSYSFQTRDGTFGKPQRLTPRNVEVGLVGNQAGLLVASWRTSEMHASEVVVYDPDAAVWGAVTQLATDEVNGYDYPCVALNEGGEALAILNGAQGVSWSRYADGHWSTAKPTTARSDGTCALAADGTGAALYSTSLFPESDVVISTLSPKNVWAEKSVQSNSGAWIVRPYEDRFLIVDYSRVTSEAHSIFYDSKSGRTTQKLITSEEINVVNLQTLGDTALLTWNATGARAALFDGDEWVTEELGPAAGAIASGIGPRGHVAAWYYQDSLFATLYDAENGWEEPLKLGSAKDAAVWYAPNAVIDAAGNALAAWPDATSISWRRRGHGSDEWAKLQQLEDQDPLMVVAHADGGGNVTLVWSNPLGVWASRFE